MVSGPSCRRKGAPGAGTGFNWPEPDHFRIVFLRPRGFERGGQKEFARFSPITRRNSPAESGILARAFLTACGERDELCHLLPIPNFSRVTSVGFRFSSQYPNAFKSHPSAAPGGPPVPCGSSEPWARRADVPGECRPFDESPSRHVICLLAHECAPLPG